MKEMKGRVRNMKRTLIIMLTLAVALAALMAGCANNNQQPSPTPATESPGVTPPGEAGAVKTGLGMVISVAKSANAADGNDTLAQADVVMAAVTLDAQGKIAGVKIDSTQTKLSFDAQGQLITDITAEQKTKVELGDAYGMARVSGIGKEWYEQIAALEDWMIGKTVDEVMAMQTSNEGAPEEADLTSSVTIGVPDYLKAVQKAAGNAMEFGAVTTGETKTGLGTVISLAKSKDAAADEEGLAQTDNVAAAVTIDENGVISGVMIDTAQVIIRVNEEGVLTTDLAAEQKTKVEQGDAYGMAQVSGIGKEWYEQIAVLSQWMIGKTIDQVTQMQMDAEGKSAEADLVSSVTIRVGDYMKAVQKAVANAG
jgi:YD repeat-containing protein